MESSSNISFLEDYLGIKFNTCKSSNIVAFGFDPKNNSLWILFKGEVVYQYPEQTPEAYDELCRADSKGSWVHNHLVKNQAKCNKYRIHNKSTTSTD